MRGTQLQDVAAERDQEAVISECIVATENPRKHSPGHSVLTGRALDAAVAEAVLGWRHYDHGTSERRTLAPPGWAAGVLRQDYDLVPAFSTDLAAAWTVAEALAERGWQTQLMNGSGGDGLGEEGPGKDTGWHCAFIRLGAAPGGGRGAGAGPAEGADIEHSGIQEHAGIQGVGIEEVSVGVSGRTAAEAICRAALGVAEFLSHSFLASLQARSSGSEAGHEGT